MAELCYNTLNEGNRLKTQMHNVLLQVLEIEPFNLFWASLRDQMSRSRLHSGAAAGNRTRSVQ